MANFQVRGEFLLQDRFSAAASAISAKTSLLTSKMEGLKGRLMSAKAAFLGFGIGMLAMGKSLDLRNVFKHGIEEEVSERRFTDMFARSSIAAEGGMKRLRDKMAQVSKEASLDFSDVQNSFSDTFLKNEKLTQSRMERVMTATIDLVREKGLGTQEEIQEHFELINRAMMAPERSAKVLMKLGISERGQSMLELVKTLKSMKTEDAQEFILRKIEEKFGGFRNQDNLESGIRRFESAKQNLLESVSKVVGSVFMGPIKEMTQWMERMGTSFSEGGKGAETLKNSLTTLRDIFQNIFTAIREITPFIGKFTTGLMIIRFLGPWGKLLAIGEGIMKVFQMLPQHIVRSNVALGALIAAGAAAAYAFLGPIGAISLAIALISDNWTAITNKIDSWTGVPDTVGKSFQALLDIISAVASAISNIISGIGKVASFIGSGVGKYAEISNKVTQAGALPGEHGIGNIASAIGHAITSMPGAANRGLDALTNAMHSFFGDTKNKAQGEVTVNIKDPGGNVGSTSATGKGMQLKVGTNTAGSRGK